MKRALRIIALLVVLVAVAVWLATGANRGWTKTSVPVKTLDEVTGIEGISYQKKFLPGVDFPVLLSAAARCSPALRSFFANHKKSTDHKTTNKYK